MDYGFTVIGNWKMHKTAREAVAFLETLIPQGKGSLVNICIAVPYTSIAVAAAAAKNSSIVIGAENMQEEGGGAFTGEVSGVMLREAGASFVLLGHSERRNLFGETEAQIEKKLQRALVCDLTPILCIGESLEEREAEETEKTLRKQLDSALRNLPPEMCGKIFIAYEPLWAIGTGLCADAETAQRAHAWIRKCLERYFGKEAALIPILYGGSVKPENAAQLALQQDINGLLVGGASLDASSFLSIINQVSGKKKI